jgi:hypothetical protein
MRSPAAAVAWEFRQRHRWGLIALAGYFLVLAVIRVTVLTAGQRVHFADEMTFAFVVVVPITSTFIYFLAVFTFGLSGDLAARQSMYPARMFTLPMTSAALAGWPMLYGTLAMTILWVLTRLLALWPAGTDVPILWPALLAASLLAWTQALTWMSYPLPGLRVAVIIVWLTVIDSVVLIALHYGARELVMLALLVPHVPLAYLAARSAVARARRGDVPDWRLSRRLAQGGTRPRTDFRSAAHAQRWLEWRLHGRSLPVLVAILLPLELLLLFIFRETPVIVFETLLLVLFTPPFMAAFVAATVGKSNPGSDSHGVAPFLATRPLSSMSLIAAKLRVTVGSTLAAWLLVLLAVPVALKLSGTAPLVIERSRAFADVMGAPRAVALELLGFAALLAATWKQLVQSLYIGMSGREWAVKASVFVPLSFLAAMVPLARWITRNKATMAWLWNAFPAILAALVVLKISAGLWIAIRLRDGGLLSDRTLILGALGWSALVFAIDGLLAWIFPDLLVGGYVLALVAILLVPLARLSAAPLALSWNRHR